MNPERKCPQCGGPLDDNVAAGQCPKCIAKMVLGRPADESLPPSEPSSGQPLPPPAEGDGKTVEIPKAGSVSEQAGDQIGRYKLLEKLGEGGMGIVWLAEQKEPVQRKVALKVVKAGMDSAEVLARFDAERQALALMDHPNIAMVLDAGATPSGRPYFVMELVKGTPITRFCDEQRLSVPERLELFKKVCQAVQHAHQKGIIHRDIKPSNVMVTLSDGKPVPKVIDFGLAKAMGASLTDRTLHTLQGVLLGTPVYMSPEQAKMNPMDIDTRSDIYSLGVMLYELLTGSTPLTRETVHGAAIEEVLRMIREQDPPTPSHRLTQLGDKLTTVSTQRKLEPRKLSREVQGDLDWIVMKALEKDRNRRYETANAFARDIERHLNNEPVQAGPPTARYRLQKFVRRHRIAAAFAVLLVVATLVSTGLSMWANRERKIANQKREEAVKAQKAESKAKDEAGKQRKLTEAALSQLQIRRAEESFKADDASEALAHLVRVLRQNPRNRIAAERLMSALTHRNYALPIIELLKHNGSVISAQFSPDGQRLVTASEDKTARLWDARTGQPLAVPLEHKGSVLSAQFSPDGQQVVTASEDETARVWDVQTGQPLTEPLKHNDMVLFAEFSPDGQRLATASSIGFGFSTGGEQEPGYAQVWDARTGRPLTVPLKHEAPVHSARFSPSGQWVVTACGGFGKQGYAQIWDAQTGQPMTKPMMHNEMVLSAQFSPDGQQVVTASYDQTARVWDARTGQPLTKPMTHNGRVWSAQFSPDGQRVVTASLDSTARVWDARTGRPLNEPLKHDLPVISAQFSPDGQRVVTVCGEDTGKQGYAQVWDAQTGQQMTERLKHNLMVRSAQFSPDGQWVVTASFDQTARVWDARKGQPLIEVLKHSSSVVVWIRDVYSAQFSRDGQRVVTASGDSTARVWDARTGQPVTKSLSHDAQVRSAQFSPDGQHVVTASMDRTAVSGTGGAVYAGRCQRVDSGDEESSCSQFQWEFQRDCHYHCAVPGEWTRTESLCPGRGFAAGAVALLDLPEVSRGVGLSASQANTSGRCAGIPGGQAPLQAGMGLQLGHRDWFARGHRGSL